MLNRLPEDIKTIIEGLGSECIVENYISQYMGWSVDIVIRSKRFNLVKEWHQVFISETTKEGSNHLWPKKDQTNNLGLKNVAEAINEFIA
ncbi:MAG: hypothetical protein AB2747_18100 [Candidatus Thiodiazotropha taylori]